MSKKTGFLVGALVGAAAALFLAPKKGSELREEAGKIYDDLKEGKKIMDIARKTGISRSTISKRKKKYNFWTCNDYPSKGE